MSIAQFVRGIGGGEKSRQSARTGAMPVRLALLVASFILASVAIVLLGLVVRFFASDAAIPLPILIFAQDAFRADPIENKFADQLRIYIVICWFLLINTLIFISTVLGRDLYKVVISNVKNYLYIFSPFNILIVVMISAYLALDVFQIVRVREIIYDEDGIAETATVVFLLLSTCLLISSAGLIRQKEKPAAVLLILASIFAFFVAMEEVSWGQTIFGWETPALFAERNYQSETNLHNLLGEKHSYLIYIEFGFGFAISTLIVLAFEFSGADRLRHFRKLAPSEKMLLFALILPVGGLTSEYHELLEELLSVGLLFYAMTLWATLRGSSIGTAIRDGLGGRLRSGGPASILNDRNIGTSVFVIFVMSGLLLFWLYSAP